jgi:hypothetical protein
MIKLNVLFSLITKEKVFESRRQRIMKDTTITVRIVPHFVKCHNFNLDTAFTR